MDETGGRLDGDRKRGPCKRPRQHIASQSTEASSDFPLTSPEVEEVSSDSEMEPAPASQPVSEGTAGDQPMPAATGDGTARDDEKVWSAMVEIDAGFPFDIIWPMVRSSVCNALRTVHNKWPDMGWRSATEMEEALRQAVEKDGVGAIARGLTKAEAESVAQQLQGEMTCFVRVDREGAGAAAAATSTATTADSGDRRDKIRQRIQELRDGEGVHQLPMFSDILDRLENDIDDDERWQSLAPAMEHMLDRMSSRGGEVLRTFFGGVLVPAQKRTTTITIDRARPLESALWPMLRASPEEMRPGRLRVKYKGEEGEDGEGGGGVTRVFFTQAGKQLAEAHFGLLLPALGGHFQLSPRPGFLTPGADDIDSVYSRPDSWSRLLGRLFGMAVVHECPLGILLVPSLCKQLLGKDPTFDDLQFAPGLNDGGAGWYSSLKAMLAHRAPELVKEDASMVIMDADTVNDALRDLDTTMISRSQQTFESLAAYVGSTASTPHLWEGAAGVAACLLMDAKSEVQRKLALSKTRDLLEGIAAVCPHKMPITQGLGRALRGISKADSSRGFVSAMQWLGGQSEDGSRVRELIKILLRSAPSEETESAARVDWRQSSDLKPLRPTHIPSITEWFTTGAKQLARSSGRYYHEVELDDDFFDPAPQLGWQTDAFVEKDGDGNGVGDDEHGWAADGVRHKKWHDGHSAASWPRTWRGGDVIGMAINIDAGELVWSLNGEWVPNAKMTMTAAGRKFFPSVSMKGKFVMNIPRDKWRYSPPSSDYQPWAWSGCYTRPTVLPQPAEAPPLERQVSRVEGVGLGEGLSESNLQTFAEAVTRKALAENLRPYLGMVVQEFSSIVNNRLRQNLTWKEVQERISGQQLEPEAFVQAWREKTTYQCCDEASPSVLLWWRYVSGLIADELLQLFSWCTGFAAVPITAWKFQIKLVDDCARCPTVNTCLTDDPSAANRGVKMPTLYLPAYETTEILAKRMEWAIAGATAINLH